MMVQTAESYMCMKNAEHLCTNQNKLDIVVAVAISMISWTASDSMEG